MEACHRAKEVQMWTGAGRHDQTHEAEQSVLYRHFLAIGSLGSDDFDQYLFERLFELEVIDNKSQVFGCRTLRVLFPFQWAMPALLVFKIRPCVVTPKRNRDLTTCLCIENDFIHTGASIREEKAIRNPSSCHPRPILTGEHRR